MLLTRLNQFRRWAGIDRAVFFCNAAQLMRLITGPITMALVLRHLTPEIQGYFYAFSGVVATQVFLEMGFSQNILQFAAHEFAKLRLTSNKTLEGDPAARSRFISLGRLAFGYYAVAAVIFIFAVGIGGHLFFAAASKSGVQWQGAWWIIAVSAGVSLAINPAWSLLEGCNQVAAIAQFRFWAATACFSANALGLITGAGIYASAFGAALNVILSLAYLFWRWWSFIRQFLEKAASDRISWAREIWPLQWRIAVSWISNYFVFDVINPIAFYFCGPAEAGRLGMSMQLVRMVSAIAYTWIGTKGPRFGALVATRNWIEFDMLWRRSTLQVFFFYLLGYACFLLAIPFVGLVYPTIPARLAPFSVNAWLGGALVTQMLVGAMAMELRAYKREPYMWLSVANAVLSVAFMLALVRIWGIAGQAIGYALALWAIFIPAVKIYRTKRIECRKAADSMSNDRCHERRAQLPNNPIAQFQAAE